jgi:hypothetical protein
MSSRFYRATIDGRVRFRRMNGSREPSQQVRRRHLLSWATENPLFAAGAIALVAGILVVTVLIAQDYVGPGKHVVVEFYDVNIEQTVGDTTMSLNRVTYQPGIDVRLSSFLRRNSKPLIIVDGIISNGGEARIIAFFTAPSDSTGLVVSRLNEDEFVSSVNTTGAGLCRNGSTRIPTVEPGKSRRFNVSFAADRGSDYSWMKEELRNGQLPALSFGPFVKGDCSVVQTDLPESEIWRLDFTRQELPPVELRDYYPFGAPTASEFSLNKRRYWTDWLPRVN